MQMNILCLINTLFYLQAHFKGIPSITRTFQILHLLQIFVKFVNVNLKK
jgi:hypothetical protein